MKKSIFNFNAIPKKNHLNFKASNNFISSSQRLERLLQKRIVSTMSQIK